jgi:ABC-type multidrug transport system ATPase subunit
MSLTAIEPPPLCCCCWCAGLDSASAELVVRVLRNVARRKPCACLMTIHQPSAKLFGLFDSILVLSRTGLLTYFGPTAGAVAHFTQVVGVPEPPKFVTLAEWLLEMMASGNT